AVISVAAASFWKGRHAAPAEGRKPGPSQGGPESRRKLVYLVIAISGCSALGAEVLWTRLLSLLLGGTVYTFSIILAVFLLGLWAGSGAGSFLARGLQHAALMLAASQALLVVAIAWTGYTLAH